MAKLSEKQRDKLPKEKFALPETEQYPIPDKSHASNAKARATQMENEGKLSHSKATKVKAAANKVLKTEK